MPLTFDHQAHRYALDGREVPSVTGILRDNGLIRFDQVPTFILERARNRGAAVHALCHYYNEGDLDWTSVDPSYRPYLEAWVACAEERRVRPLLCEHRIASRRHQLAGTLDLLCEIDGDGWLLDFACGDPVACSKQLQTAAYLGLAFESRHQDAALEDVLGRHQRWRRASVRLRHTKRYTFHEYNDPRDYTRFQTLTAAWHIRREFGGLATLEGIIA